MVSLLLGALVGGLIWQSDEDAVKACEVTHSTETCIGAIFAD